MLPDSTFSVDFQAFQASPSLCLLLRKFRLISNLQKKFETRLLPQSPKSSSLLCFGARVPFPFFAPLYLLIEKASGLFFALGFEVLDLPFKMLAKVIIKSDLLDALIVSGWYKKPF